MDNMNFVKNIFSKSSGFSVKILIEVISNWKYICPAEIYELLEPIQINDFSLILSCESGVMIEATTYKDIIKNNINTYVGKEVIKRVILYPKFH